MWVLPDFVRIVFITLLTKKDRDHVVRSSAFAIGRAAFPGLSGTEPERLVLEALKVLSSPDEGRIEPQEFEGRRIERVADGWKVLNGQKYQDEMQKINQREYNRLWMQEEREKMEAMTPEELVAYQKGKEKRYHKHRKLGIRAARRNGEVAGGTDAVNDGYADATAPAPESDGEGSL